MNCRFASSFAIGLLSIGSAAQAQRFLKITGTNATPDQVSVYIGVQSVGSPTITPLLGPAYVPAGQYASIVCDQLMPEIGIQGVGKRGNVPGTVCSIQVFPRDDIQFWISFDQSNWHLIPVGTDIQFENTNIQAGDFGSNGPGSVPAAAPATSGIGLGIMLFMAAVSALILFRRERELQPLARNALSSGV